jgi:hypothetical protein
VAAGVPVPKTEIVRLPDDWHRLSRYLDGPDGDIPEWGDRVFAQVREAADRVGPYPVFLRTGQGSGKHDWGRCCFVGHPDDIIARVIGLVEWSCMVDFMGLRYDVFAAREMLPVEPVAVLSRYNGMPLVAEVRGFVSNGEAQCLHPYWPTGSIRQGMGDVPADFDDIVARSRPTPEEIAAHVRPLLDRVAAAFAGDGAWSVDVLKTRAGWFVTDMAEAERSFHWPECVNASAAMRRAYANETGEPVYDPGSCLIPVATTVAATRGPG